MITKLDNSAGTSTAAPSSDVTLDPRAVMRSLASYRDPKRSRSIFELLATTIPFLCLWTVICFALDAGYWFGFLLALPAAGLLVRLFIIQHDCGHGAFFRSRNTNDWMGRALGVVTLTPYDYWRHSHALHHANSGNLDCRGFGDIDTLTVAEFQARSPLSRLRYRLYRHPLVMFGLGPAYLFILRHRLPIGMMRSGWRPWLSVGLTNVGTAAVIAAVAWFVGSICFCLCTFRLRCWRHQSACGCSSFSTSLNALPGNAARSGRSMKPPFTEVHTMLFLPSCAGSAPISACIMCITCRAEFPSTG